MSYSAVLNMLDLGGITVRAAERGEREPLVIAGGPCAYNPEPSRILSIYSVSARRKRFCRAIGHISRI